MTCALTNGGVPCAAHLYIFLYPAHCCLSYCFKQQELEALPSSLRKQGDIALKITRAQPRKAFLYSGLTKLTAHNLHGQALSRTLNLDLQNKSVHK